MSDPGDRGRIWLEGLLVRLGLPTAVQVHHDPVDNAPNYWLTIAAADWSPERVAATLGESGATLDALQYLANMLLNVGVEHDDHCGYTIELNGFRSQQRAALESVATNAVTQVRQTGQSVAIESLSSSQRKQLHAMLAAYADITTHSEGQEPDRRLVVALKGEDQL
ncbi:MAG: RNA-binding protein [Oscillatoriales cyanobacterium]|nr:MAG: RNA-binding protein [Oscillatoriales cyanobacterium]